MESPPYVTDFSPQVGWVLEVADYTVRGAIQRGDQLRVIATNNIGYIVVELANRRPATIVRSALLNQNFRVISR